MEITEDLLIQRGFQKQINDGHVLYVKGKAIVKEYGWVPCNYETGMPLSTCIYVDTIEQLERLIAEGDNNKMI